MALRLRRRARQDPVRPAAAPPPDGAAGCLDPWSRGWDREPVAGRFIDWASAEHHAGFGAGFCGVWHEQDPLVPIGRFPIGPQGIADANALLRRAVIVPRLEERRLTGSRLVAETEDAVLLLTQEREEAGWHVHHNVTANGWFVHAFFAPPPALPETPPGSPTLAQARDRAAAEWGELDWEPVDPAVPRGLLETAAWAFARRLPAAS
jgi:hypothetical protein